MLRMCRQMPAILAVAVVAAFVFNWLRPDPLPLRGTVSDISPLTAPGGGRMDIRLPEAAGFFKNGSAVFLDARPESAYAAGHIPGALSLPWSEVDDRFMRVAAELPLDTVIITYCDGESCTLSHRLALFLMDMGFENVRVLPNGWSVWKEAGLPVESSDDH